MNPNVTVFLKFFGLAFSALLPLINPLGSALVFLGLVEGAPAPVLRDLARRIAITSTLFLALIELAGTAILHFFGISLPVMQIAGGLILASMGWGLLNQEAPQTNPATKDFSNAGPRGSKDMVFYPLTFPVTAGPGSIVVMLTLSAHVPAHRVVADVLAHLGILLAVVALSVLVYLCYGYAPKIRDRISPHTVQGILRVIAFVLFCIGVQIAWNGLQPLLRTVLKP